MAKTELKLNARKLRMSGGSLKDIAGKLKVSKSTVSLWCSNIRLSKKQLGAILISKEYLIARGRLKGAEFQRQRRLRAIREAARMANSLGRLSKNEFFIAGLALYLAEGTKNYGTVQFTNSDARVVKFMIEWFHSFYGVSVDDLRCAIHINIVHKSREKKVVSFWKKYLALKLSNFTPIRYITLTSKKVYTNHEQYYGTMDIRIKKSTNLLYQLNAYTNRLLSVPR